MQVLHQGLDARTPSALPLASPCLHLRAEAEVCRDADLPGPQSALPLRHALFSLAGLAGPQLAFSGKQDSVVEHHGGLPGQGAPGVGSAE